MKRRIFRNIFAALTISFIGIGAVTSCAPKEVDIVQTNETVRLKVDYKDENGKPLDFFKSGITQVQSMANSDGKDNFKPYTVIDGDTAHFKSITNKNGLIKIRFYGIDTPESTGTVEPYGKKASNFTKEILDKSKTIVITSTDNDLLSYNPPQADSTGTRYLGMVWVSEKENCPFDELVLLNLWIVQEGLSYVKNLDSFPAFKDIFIEAEDQAKKFKKNLHSGVDDDEFNYGDYEMTDLLSIQDAIIEQLKNGGENPYNNKRVRVRGTVAGYTNNMLFLQGRYEDETTGEIRYAGINLFCGMSPVSSKYTKLNTFIEVSALALDSENFGFQLTSPHSFPQLSNDDDPNGTKVIYTAKQVEEEYPEYKVYNFEKNQEQLSVPNYNDLFSPVSITTDLYVYDGYDSQGIPVEPTLYTKAVGENGAESKFRIYIPFLYSPYADKGDVVTKWSSYENYVGKTIRVTGIYSFHKAASGKVSYQIIPRTNADIKLIED